MKPVLLSFLFVILASTLFAQNKSIPSDSLKLVSDSNRTYYQHVYKVANNVPDSLVYIRILEFMAARNIQQSYADEPGKKIIFTTAQHLNNNLVYVGDDSDTVNPHSVQFAIILDLKSQRYRCTIDNAVFFLPEVAGNRRETLTDLYLKSTTAGSKRVARDTKKLLESFERYMYALTSDLHLYIDKKQVMYKSDF